MADSKKKSGENKTDSPSTFLIEKLKNFVRAEGTEFLKDPNITSIGIGYKKIGDETTKELAIQFTVGKKVGTDIIEALGSNPIPSSINVEGIEVPTDVIQRSYEPSFRIVSEQAANSRKTRINPIVPGVSVGHFRISAGTIGAIVFDSNSGAPYILSNWHVLHGKDGRIGDDVVQPGAHDDNRIQQNKVGVLIRSHLGVAGDCAVASITDRGFQREVFDINTTIEELGEPELGDKLIKSGRTTNVTHGIVTRIHTIVNINYGGNVGSKDIGGFEIGPDPDNLPGDGEISMGGDSGAAWIFKEENGGMSKIMAGLHFAGESSNDTDEHALACYPRSVFEKLEITLKEPVQKELDRVATGTRTGYDITFLGPTIVHPKLTGTGSGNAFERDGSEIIPYTHFSLAINKIRRFPFWVAWNIDGGKILRINRVGIPFITDPNVPLEFQVDDSLYAGNRLDRGHIARRADLCWGTESEANQANVDSFFFTNITPQMDNFNQSSQGGIWGRLENAVFEDVDVENLKVSVFGGPLFRMDDREFRGIKIPREFYKIIAFKESGKLKAKGFILTQNLNQLEILELDQFKVFEVTISEIEQRSDVRFPKILKDADALLASSRNRAEILGVDRKPLESTDQINW